MTGPSVIQAASNAANGAAVTVALSAVPAGKYVAVLAIGVGTGANPSAASAVLGSESMSALASAFAPGGNGSFASFHIPAAAGGETSLTVTFTGGSGGGQGAFAFAWVLDGMPSASALDRFVFAANAATASWSSGATPATAQASEIALGVGFALQSGAAITMTGPGTPWADVTQRGLTLASFSGAALGSSDILSSAGAVTYAGTASRAAFSVAAVVTLEASTGTSALVTTAAAVAGAASVPVPAVTVPAAPAAVTAVASFGTPALSAAAAPAAVTAAGSVPAPAVRDAAAPAAVTGTASVGTPGLSSAAAPAAVTAVASAPAPAASAGGSAQVAAAAVAGACSVPVPAVAGSGTDWTLQDYSSPPGSPSSFGTQVVVGLAVKTTTAPLWLKGYRYYVAAGQATTPVTCALWQSTTVAGGIGERGYFVPGSQVTSGTLTPGVNTILLPRPMLLTQSPLIEGYVAVLGPVTAGPQVVNQFGSGDPLAAGIVNGPLQAFSDASGTNPLPNGHSQAPFTGGTDPTTTLPSTGFESGNWLVDVIVTDTPPDAATYRLWPAMPQADPSAGLSTPGFFGTVGLQVDANQDVVLRRLWWYSGAGADVLPSRCAVFDATTQAVVAGTDMNPPSWLKPDGTAAAAGDGEIYADYSASAPLLRAGSAHVLAVFGGDGTHTWRNSLATYFAGAGPAASGISAGPITAPAAGASAVSNNSWLSGTWGWPTSHDVPDGGENNWIDAEVQIAGESAGPTPAPVTAAASVPAPAVTAGTGALPAPAAVTGLAAVGAPALAAAAAGVAVTGLAAIGVPRVTLIEPVIPGRATVGAGAAASARAGGGPRGSASVGTG